jgi:hypothetical protein
MSTFTTVATGTAAIATTVAPNIDWQLEEVRLTLSSAGGAGSLTITVDHGSGSAFDVNLLTQDMTSVTTLVWSPARPKEFRSNDEVDIAWANANGRTYGLEVIHKGR